MQDSVNFAAIERLEREISYRDLLLEEVIHRTKNQLQATIFAIDDEAEAANNPETGRPLRRIKGQLIDLAQSHSETFGTPDEAHTSLADRLMRLCASVQDSYGVRARRIRILFAMGDMSLPRHQEIGLTLVLRELVSNACKHAFPVSRRGTVIVELGLDGGSCRLRVYDDGIGYEPGVIRTTGLRLVAAFARGLRGRFDLRSDCGTVAELSFPLVV
jgi:two-component sensor histidine kinase